MACRILIVEDEKKVSELIEEAVSEAGYETKVVHSGKEALAEVNLFQPQLVLTDHNMPDVTGFEMLKELRQKENYVAVIFISARSDAGFIAEVLKQGADDFIRKPFMMDELLARIEVSLRNGELHEKLMQANSKLQQLIEKDYLTGLYNMRSMYDRIDYELKRAKRFDRSVSCIMLDMDDFKTVNDNHDHLFGSFVLQEVGEIIKSTMREIDFAARYGGDEFLVVLTEAGAEGTRIFCERLKAAIEGKLFKSGGDEKKLTASIGFALSDKNNQVSARQLVRQADQALYKAKDAGRNIVAECKEEESS